MTRISDKTKQAIKKFYKIGVRGFGILATMKKFNVNESTVRRLTNSKYKERQNKRVLEYYYRLKKKGICNCCGNKK